MCAFVSIIHSYPVLLTVNQIVICHYNLYLQQSLFTAIFIYSNLYLQQSLFTTIVYYLTTSFFNLSFLFLPPLFSQFQITYFDISYIIHIICSSIHFSLIISITTNSLPNFLLTSSILPTKYLNTTTFPNSTYPHTYTPYFMPFSNYSITPNPTNLTFFFRRHSTLVNRTRLRNFLTSTQT